MFYYILLIHTLIKIFLSKSIILIGPNWLFFSLLFVSCLLPSVSVNEAEQFTRVELRSMTFSFIRLAIINMVNALTFCGTIFNLSTLCHLEYYHIGCVRVFWLGHTPYPQSQDPSRYCSHHLDE